MSTRATTYAAEVVAGHPLSAWLVRLTLSRPNGWASTGLPDEWVALTLPGQYQSRYYTVRSCTADELALDIVLHGRNHHPSLVSRWASSHREGEVVTVSAPQGSFAPPADAGWLRLVGDATALPAIARILETTHLPARAWIETPGGEVPGYLPLDADVTWSTAPSDRPSATADLVQAIAWPDGPGYLWMAGESAQMRAVRRHLMRDLGRPSTAYATMGYWRTSRHVGTGAVLDGAGVSGG